MGKELTADFSAKTTGFSSGISKLKDDLTSLNKAMDDNKRAVSAANKEVKDLEKQQEQLKKEISNSGKATKEQTEQMEKLDIAIEQAKLKSARLKTEQAELKTGIKNTTTAMQEQKTKAEQSGVSLDNVKTSAASLGKTLATTAAGFSAVVAATYAMTASAGAAADDINTLSKQYGLTTEEIQKFKYATDLIDVSLEAYTGSLARNVRSMTAYQKGTADTIAAYNALGVAVTNADGSLRDSHAVYNDTITALGKIEDETQRDSLAMTILGKSAQQLNPLILGGAEALEELGAQAESLGLILPQENLDNLNEFNDKIDILKANTNGLKMVVADSFANSFDSFFEAGDDLLEFVQKLKADGTLDEMAETLGDSIKTLVGILESAITIGWQYRDVIVAGVTAMIAFKSAMAVGTLIAGVSTAIKTLTTANNTATISQQALNTAMNANPYVLVASAITAVVGGIVAYGIASSNSADKVSNLAQRTSSLADSAKSAVSETKSLEDVIAKYGDISNSVDDNIDKKSELAELQSQLNGIYGKEAEQIDLVNGKYEEQINKLQSLSAEQKIRYANQVADDLAEAKKKANEVGGTSAKIGVQFDESTADYLRKSLGEIYEEANEGLSPLATRKFVVDGDIDFGNSGNFDMTLNGTLDEQIKTLEQLKQAMLDSGEAGGELSGAYDAIYDKLDELTTIRDSVTDLEQAQKDLTQTAKASAEPLNEHTKSVKDWHEQAKESIVTAEQLAEITNKNKTAVNDTVSAYDKLNKVMTEQNENGSLSISTALELIDSGYSACLTIDQETNAIRLNEQAYKDLIVTKSNTQQASLDLERQELNLLNVQLASQAASAAQSRDDTRLAQIQQQIATNDERLAAIEVSSAVYVDIVRTVTTEDDKGGDDYGDDYYKDAYTSYKTEADKKIELINRELEAKRKLKEETIAAIDEEIAARKKLNEDSSLEKEINAIKAQLKYSQLDEFSRGQLENQLSGLYDTKSETEWQRQKQAEKDKASADYTVAETQLKSSQTSINDSLNTFKQIMDSLASGITNISNIVNNNVTKNNTANINMASQALSMAQITKAVKNALMDDIVI